MKINLGDYSRTMLFLVLLGVVHCNLLMGQIDPSMEVRYVITHVNVVDVKKGEVRPDQSILVSKGIIESVWNSDEVDINDFKTVIDAQGKYAIPGLWDMHAHMRGDHMPPFITTDWMMPLFIANGVTGVRDMTSSCESPDKGPVCLDQMKEWQHQVFEGTLMGPRLLALSTYQLNPPWDQKMTRKQAKELVKGFAEQRVDLIKTYFRLSPKAFGMIAKEAEKHDIAVSGHIPLRMSVAEASRKGLRSLEHARDLLFDGFFNAKDFRKSAMSQDPSMELMHAMVDLYDPERTSAIFETMIKNDTWYVPTHVTRRMEAFADEPSFRQDPRNQYIPPMLLDAWIADADRVVALDSSAYGREAYRKFYRKGLEITGEAFNAGVRILVGTDGGDSFVYPGFAVHDELEELVSAGLTPIQALRAATLDAAEFLDLEERFGAVEPGKEADFLLLDANPVQDIGHTKDIYALIYRGRYLDRERLDGMLERVKSLPFGN